MGNEGEVVHALSEEMAKEHQAGETKLYGEAAVHGPSSREKAFLQVSLQRPASLFPFQEIPKQEMRCCRLWALGTDSRER